MNCPNCNSRATGKIGPEDYYCWDCCCEFHFSEEGTHLFEVLEDGERLEMDSGEAMGE